MRIPESQRAEQPEEVTPRVEAEPEERPRAPRTPAPPREQAVRPAPVESTPDEDDWVRQEVSRRRQTERERRERANFETVRARADFESHALSALGPEAQDHGVAPAILGRMLGRNPREIAESDETFQKAEQEAAEMMLTTREAVRNALDRKSVV